MIVLDTNVLSELMRPTPATEVVQWIGRRPASLLFITTLTVAEILYDIALLPPGKKRKALEEAAKLCLEEDFRGRILSFDLLAASAFADIVSKRRGAGIPISQIDAQISAIAHSQGAALATRNTKDFTQCGLTLHNPWED